MNPVKSAVIAADGVGQFECSAHWDGRGANRTPVQQVRGNLQHIIAARRAGKQKREIGFADYLWR